MVFKTSQKNFLRIFFNKYTYIEMYIVYVDEIKIPKRTPRFEIGA